METPPPANLIQNQRTGEVRDRFLSASSRSQGKSVNLIRQADPAQEVREARIGTVAREALIPLHVHQPA